MNLSRKTKKIPSLIEQDLLMEHIGWVNCTDQFLCVLVCPLISRNVYRKQWMAWRCNYILNTQIIINFTQEKDTNQLES